MQWAKAVKKKIGSGHFCPKDTIPFFFFVVPCPLTALFLRTRKVSIRREAAHRHALAQSPHPDLHPAFFPPALDLVGSHVRSLFHSYGSRKVG